MKNIKKCGLLALMSIAALGFFGCADEPEDDNDLVVSITDNQNIVSIASPDEYNGKDVKIIYTTDGTEPVVKLNTDKTNVEIPKANSYSDPFEISESVTVKARGYYYDSVTKAFYKGPVATEKVTYTTLTSSSETSASAEGTSTGIFTFKLASTGNSISTHYFDTSNSNVFKLNNDHPTAYYQTQFTWKGNGKGTWYLYMRDLGGSLIKASENSNFLAKGTYSGDCFNSTKGDVATGDLALLDSLGASAGTISIDDDKKFILKVTNSGATTSGTSDTLGTFTVADAK